MTTFDYHEPATLAEALKLVKEHGDDANLIAGGTNLVIMMRQGLVQPKHVIGMRKLKELRGIAPTSQGGIEIGALTTHREVERSAMVERFFPALCETFGHIATVRIRNQATVGGNIVHADPAQDPPPMLLALNAEIVVASDGKTRTVPATEFFKDFFEVAIEEGEIVTAIRIPPQPSGAKGTYVKFLPQSKDDYATVSVAAVLKLAGDGTCEDVRIGLGALGPTPLRAPKTEAALKGQKLTDKLVADAAALVRDEVDPLDDIRGSAKYKREMARVWTERALKSLIQ
jgi:carbon-monoxide dehydrogenase medium subunit